MKQQAIGQTGLTAGRLFYGAMRIAGTWNPAEVDSAKREAGKKALIAAYEAGYTLFDHADICCRSMCEDIHGELMREIPSSFLVKKRGLASPLHE
jgi:aryl-alcohol dehydrogenase-like predicted oxidoreductase